MTFARVLGLACTAFLIVRCTPQSAPDADAGQIPDSGVDAGDDAGTDAGALDAGDGGAHCQAAPVDSCGAGQACVLGECVPYIACLDDGGCEALQLPADPESTEPGTYLVGWADPTIRRSLDGSTIFMAYSWATTYPTIPKPTLVIQTHLEQSVDDGATWTNTVVLHQPPGLEIIPGSSPADAGVAGSEEISLVAAPLDLANLSVPYWVSVREKYYRPPGGPLLHDTYHLRVGMAQSATPAALAGGESNEQVILNKDNPAWFRNAMPLDSVYLPTVMESNPDQQADCDYPVSPALYYQAPSLYLVFQCYVNVNPITSSELVVLKTEPYSTSTSSVLPPTSWVWSYVGRFGDHTDAANMQAQVDGALVPAFVPNMVFMPDLALGNDGTLLLIATPVIQDVNGDGRTGCQVFEMDSIDPPRLRHAGGGLVRRAIADAPDLYPTRYDFLNNSGSCGYEPTATHMGLLLAKKHEDPVTLITTSVLHDTHIHE